MASDATKLEPPSTVPAARPPQRLEARHVEAIAEEEGGHGRWQGEENENAQYISSSELPARMFTKGRHLLGLDVGAAGTPRDAQHGPQRGTPCVDSSGSCGRPAPPSNVPSQRRRRVGALGSVVGASGGPLSSRHSERLKSNRLDSLRAMIVEKETTSRYLRERVPRLPNAIECHRVPSSAIECDSLRLVACAPFHSLP